MHPEGFKGERGSSAVMRLEHHPQPGLARRPETHIISQVSSAQRKPLKSLAAPICAKFMQTV